MDAATTHAFVVLWRSGDVMTKQQRLARVADLADLVEHHPAERGVLSSGERIAVALVLRRMDWLQADGFEDLEAAADYLEPDWMEAVKAVTAERLKQRIRLVPREGEP
jgi:hypothetical protein